TEFPGAMAIGQTANVSYSEKVGFLTSYQANELGINIIFAPVLDINNNPKNPVINTRSFGSYLEQVLEMGTAYERGARRGGSLPVIKHFPGHGDTNIDSHLGLPIIQKTLSEIENFELIPFRKAIENGAKAVMSAHIVYPEIDPKYPATLSPKILQGILRERLGFQGIVFTDAMEMHAISKNYKEEKRGTLAILAGADIILLTSYGKTTKEYYEMILESLENGEFQKDEKNLLDEAVTRQIALKIEQGLFSHPESYYQIQDESIKNYFKELKERQKTEYFELEKEGIETLNTKISKEAIRSYLKPFTPLSLENLSNYEFVIRNKVLKKELKNLKVSTRSEKKFWKKWKKLKNKTFIFDIKNAEELAKLQKKLKNPRERNIILLNYGNPFLEYPNWKNLQVIFTFSPTRASFQALVESLFGKEEISKAKLLFEETSK
ncbi:MAG: glycoside hydrolase family 3 protein, partial [Leptospiraceae bacterium]|nr:glycoside hydrolase family 3 protein [Leptospiraceae bacterium]